MEHNIEPQSKVEGKKVNKAGKHYFIRDNLKKLLDPKIIGSVVIAAIVVSSLLLSTPAGITLGPVILGFLIVGGSLTVLAQIYKTLTKKKEEQSPKSAKAATKEVPKRVQGVEPPKIEAARSKKLRLSLKESSHSSLRPPHGRQGGKQGDFFKRIMIIL